MVTTVLNSMLGQWAGWFGGIIANGDRYGLTTFPFDFHFEIYVISFEGRQIVALSLVGCGDFHLQAGAFGINMPVGKILSSARGYLKCIRNIASKFSS